MENPFHWTEAEHTIFDALERIRVSGPASVVGASRVKVIYEALKEKGFITKVGQKEGGRWPEVKIHP